MAIGLPIALIVLRLEPVVSSSLDELINGLADRRMNRPPSLMT
jgi:hypothetical protein